MILSELPTGVEAITWIGSESSGPRTIILGTRFELTSPGVVTWSSRVSKRRNDKKANLIHKAQVLVSSVALSFTCVSTPRTLIYAVNDLIIGRTAADVEEASALAD